MKDNRDGTYTADYTVSSSGSVSVSVELLKTGIRYWSFGNSNWEGKPTFKVNDYAFSSIISYIESFVYSSGYYHASIIAYGRVLAPITGTYTFYIGSTSG